MFVTVITDVEEDSKTVDVVVNVEVPDGKLVNKVLVEALVKLVDNCIGVDVACAVLMLELVTTGD